MHTRAQVKWYILAVLRVDMLCLENCQQAWVYKSVRHVAPVSGCSCSSSVAFDGMATDGCHKVVVSNGKTYNRCVTQLLVMSSILGLGLD